MSYKNEDSITNCLKKHVKKTILMSLVNLKFGVIKWKIEANKDLDGKVWL